jgi:hypothetical protein
VSSAYDTNKGSVLIDRELHLARADAADPADELGQVMRECRGSARVLCRSKIGSWAVNCAISDVRRLARTR